MTSCDDMAQDDVVSFVQLPLQHGTPMELFFSNLYEGSHKCIVLSQA